MVASAVTSTMTPSVWFKRHNGSSLFTLLLLSPMGENLDIDRIWVCRRMGERALPGNNQELFRVISLEQERLARARTATLWPAC